MKFCLATPRSCGPSAHEGWESTVWEVASGIFPGLILISVMIISYLIVEIAFWFTSLLLLLNFPNWFSSGQPAWFFSNAKVIMQCPWFKYFNSFHCTWEKDPNLSLWGILCSGSISLSSLNSPSFQPMPTFRSLESMSYAPLSHGAFADTVFSAWKTFLLPLLMELIPLPLSDYSLDMHLSQTR